MLELKKSSAEIFPARWYRAGVREILNDPEKRGQLTGPAFQDFHVEILGAYNRTKSQSVQNLIVNTNGTLIKTSEHLDFQDRKSVV